MDIRQQIAKSESSALEELSLMSQSQGHNDFLSHLKSYVRIRYLLEDDPYWTDDISAYTRYSISATLNRAGDSVKLADLGVSCAGSSSAETKHLLLLISLRKGLDVVLDPETVACAETIGELSDVLWKALQDSRLQSNV